MWPTSRRRNADGPTLIGEDLLAKSNSTMSQTVVCGFVKRTQVEALNGAKLSLVSYYAIMHSLNELIASETLR